MNRTFRSIAVAVSLIGATAAFAFPASGEFSAVDQVEAPAPSLLTRETVRNEAITSAQAAHKVNGEIVQEATAPLTRDQAREEGRTAMRNHTMPVGDANF